jgi:hypothetical protein
VEASPAIFGFAAVVVALLVLFVPRPIGLADNGDEARLPCHLGLAPTYAWGQTQYATSVNFLWHRGIPPEGLNCEVRSSAVVPMRVAASISRHLPGHHGLDSRVLGVLYALAFGVAVALLVAGLPRRRWPRVVGGTAFVALGTDVAFLSYFSSTYAEPLGYVALLATVGLVMIGWDRKAPPGVAWAVLVTVAASALVLAKPQFAVLALVVAAAIGLRRLAGDRRGVAWGVPLACAAVVLAAGLVSVKSNPAQFRRINLYNAYFTELLGHSPDPAADLSAFGLPTSWKRYAGTNYFQEKRFVHSHRVDRFYDQVDYAGITAFYAKRPERALRLASRGARAGADPRVPYLGMFPYAKAHPELQRTCRWCPVSSIGRLVRPAAPVGAPLLWLGSVAVAVGELWQRRGANGCGPARRGMAVGVLVSAASAILLFAAALLGDGVELTKHLYLADAAFLVMVVLGALLGGFALAEQRASRRALPGATG